MVLNTDVKSGNTLGLQESLDETKLILQLPNFNVQVFSSWKVIRSRSKHVGTYQKYQNVADGGRNISTRPSSLMHKKGFCNSLGKDNSRMRQNLFQKLISWVCSFNHRNRKWLPIFVGTVSFLDQIIFMKFTLSN